MATLKFKSDSPYTTAKNVKIPKEDIIYKGHMDDISQIDARAKPVFGFAIFGIGRAGSIHLITLAKNPRVKLLYLVEDDTSKWEPLKKYWNLEETIFLTSKEAYKAYLDKSVRAVVVASPTYTHEDIVIKSLESKKAVFCEKPIAGTIETTKKCFEKARKVGQPLLSAFNRRFDQEYSTVRERVRNGEVGHVKTIKVCSRDSPLPTIEYLTISGGIYHDCAVHDIDTIINVIGEYPTSVSAVGKANIPEIAAINDHDTVAILLSFDSGTVGIIDLSRYSNYGYDQRLEVFGYKGMIKAENQQPIHSLQSYNGIENISLPPIYFSFASRFQNGYINEMEHFLDVLEGRSELKIDPKDTLAVSKIAEACHQSAHTGKVVQLKWEKDELPLHLQS